MATWSGDELLVYKRKGTQLVSSGNVAITGLEFPSNGAGTTRFEFTGAALPTIVPLTLIWRVRPVQQTGYYTTFFWAENSFAFFNPDVVLKPYFGCHPYPQGGAAGTVHNWEISVQGVDDIVDENANDTTVVKDGTWYQQAAVATEIATDLDVNYYWNLSVNSNRLINYRSTGTWFDNQTWTSPALTFGDAPWSPTNELLSGVLRGIQIYQAALTLAQIDTLRVLETDSAVLTTTASLSLTPWYLNMNPTPTDINDKSGSAHHPAWVGANRPTLWQG